MTIKRPKISILEGDNIDILPTIPEESVDAVITDPPYNLGFMGKGWDKDTVAFYPEFWEEVMRTMKPGAHLLAFGHAVHANEDRMESTDLVLGGDLLHQRNGIVSTTCEFI